MLFLLSSASRQSLRVEMTSERRSCSFSEKSSSAFFTCKGSRALLTLARRHTHCLEMSGRHELAGGSAEGGRIPATDASCASMYYLGTT
eukprot:1110891-Prorocentrum_minimum.AAC.3